ncbi:MAG: YCF48-related protein [Ignavibacteria bacterium]|nr:YCF48-related protein [Ignavibacteria bacterium]
MKKIIITSLFFLITNYSLLIDNCLSQWVVQNSGTNANLYDIEFINRYTGWALGDGGIIIKTTNGGINWFNVPNPSIIGGGILSSIFPVDSMYCYVSGAHDIILKTTNGGSNWIEIHNGNPNGGTYNGVHFLNRDTGWFCGSTFVLRTTNGGISFDTASTPSFTSDIYFRNFNEGLYCTGGKVYKSTNSGMNWFDTNVPIGWLYEFRKISVVNNQYVSIAGGTSPYYRSTDFGTTWLVLDSIHSYPPSVLQGIAFSSVNTGYAGGSYGYLYKTTNGGYNWYRQNTGTDQRFWGSIYCYNDSIIWGCGGAGKIMFTTTGGEWLLDVNNNYEGVISDFELQNNYPNPFNSTTKIIYKINKDDRYKLELFNITGKKIETLFDKYIKRGEYEINYNANNLSSGIYFIKLSSNANNKAIKIILNK